MPRAIKLLWLLVGQFIGPNDSLYAIALANGERDRHTQCLVNGDQSAAMLTPNYFFHTLYPYQKFAKYGLDHECIVCRVDFRTIDKTAKQLYFLLRSYKPI